MRHSCAGRWLLWQWIRSRLLTAVALAACLPPAAADQSGDATPGLAGVEHQVSIAASDYHDECMPLVTGQDLDYRFSAAVPIEFFIHYHSDGRAFYPLFPEERSEGTGTFRARHDQAYCMTWTNLGDHDVVVKYRFAIVE